MEQLIQSNFRLPSSCTYCQNSDINKSFKVLKQFEQSKLYSLKAILNEEEKPKLARIKYEKEEQTIINLLIYILLLKFYLLHQNTVNI